MEFLCVGSSISGSSCRSVKASFSKCEYVNGRQYCKTPLSLKHSPNEVMGCNSRSEEEEAQLEETRQTVTLLKITVMLEVSVSCFLSAADVTVI